MKRWMARLSVGLALVGSPLQGAEYHSAYAGQEGRAIKSLSAADIEELRRGGGWGLAKAAELNGVPGPLHLLEMADEIALSAAQRERVQALYDGMKREAIPLGERLIALEASLNQRFAERHLDRPALQAALAEIGQVRAELRLVHLSTHLQTPDILTPRQLQHYVHLRGYAEDPCLAVPEGHNPTMWRKHNGCD